MNITLTELQRILANSDITLVTDGSLTTLEAAPVAARLAGKLTEHELQRRVVEECDRRAQTDARYGLCFAIPNGGARSKATAGKLKAEGVRAGVPDLFCAVPSRQYAGLFLELKISPNKPRREQREWMRRLRQSGYRVEVVYDSVEAVMGIIESYLGGER